MKVQTPKPVLLCILDGWGYREAVEYNAIAQAATPHWDKLLKECAWGLLQASEEYVGLPKGQMGNSEVGHMNIGAGRPARQLFPRINEAIANDTLRDNEALKSFISKLQQSGGDCHLMGLCSDGGVHAHLDHILTLAGIMAEAGIKVWLHIITDGRDTSPNSARDRGYVRACVELAASVPAIHLATIGGRYYSMDRDKNWDRVHHAYQVMAQGEWMTGMIPANDALEVLEQSYKADAKGDEFIQPVAFAGYPGMKKADGILMANFRPDRARQIMTAFTMQEFGGFERPLGVMPLALGMADYWAEDCPLDIPAIFPMERLDDTFGSVLAKAGKKQLRIAETEKYNHVTFFFSGGNGTFEGEDRILIPSPSVATYDLQPEMSAYEVTEKLLAAIHSGAYDAIIVNYANPDMVGHSGNLEAAIKAVEAVDRCVGQLRQAIEQAGGVMLVTADHGNAEHMRDEKGSPHTQHTVNPVPFVVVGVPQETIHVRDGGTLADIAPTMLDVIGVAKPVLMTGHSLIEPSRHTEQMIRSKAGN